MDVIQPVVAVDPAAPGGLRAHRVLGVDASGVPIAACGEGGDALVVLAAMGWDTLPVPRQCPDCRSKQATSGTD